MFKKICLVLSLVLVSASIVSAEVSKGALDGKTFIGEVKNQGAEKPDPDNFIFKDGTFRSTACDTYGFGSAPYTTSAAGKNWTIQVQTKNEKGATIAWNGLVTGNMIAGTAVMTEPSGEKTNMIFHGSIK